ncbi:hypothetical protein ACGFNX_22310 [Streptomyces sp. NPDC048723]|uniref:hypothetical protein n=1 Tax=Streptomyces sp. NPDC048723 TaxID=3365589 RepID=UPI0037249434
MPPSPALPRPGVLYEPVDLEYLTPREAVDAVTADIRALNPLPADAHGLFTATRHIDLLTAVLARLAGDAHYFSCARDSSKDAEISDRLAATAVPLAQILAHYSQALVPLTRLARTTPPSTAALDRIEVHQHLVAATELLIHAQAAVRKPVRAAAPVLAAPAKPITAPIRGGLGGGPPAAVPLALTPAQQQALRAIDGHQVEVYEAFSSRVGRRRVRTGGPDRITIQTVDALFAKRLIRRDTGTSRFAGQRLHLTEAGRDAVQSLGPAPLPAAVPAPVRATSRAR